MHAHGREYDTALQGALAEGREKISKMLIDGGAHIKAQRKRKWQRTVHRILLGPREGGADAARQWCQYQCSRRRIWQCTAGSISMWSREVGADTAQTTRMFYKEYDIKDVQNYRLILLFQSLTLKQTDQMIDVAPKFGPDG